LKEKPSLSEARDRALRIVHLCREVEAKGFNPFEVDVKEELEALRSLLPAWVKPSDLTLDGEALRSLSKVVELQDEWVRVRSKLRILDPETVKTRIAELTIPQLAEVFLKAWKPTVKIEVLTLERLKEAASYWVRLKPRSLPPEALEAPRMVEAEVSPETVKALGLTLSGDFRRLLEETFQKLSAEAEKAGGEISYWDFVRAETFRETVLKAYMVSFLATYGYVQLTLDRLKGELKLKPTPETAGKPKGEYSVAIPLDKFMVGGGEE